MNESMEAPLNGIRVLDLTRFLAGPFAGMLLADYGADVIRVESPKGRELRGTGEVRDNYFFLSANRGKRSLTIDLANPDGAELLLRLAGEADVLLENFRPGVMERWGLGGKTLTERFPRLVYASVSGFGSDGPYATRPGLDQIAQGMSGFMSLTGTEESGPTRAGIAIGDLLAGMFAAQGVSLALLERARSGRGQVVETSLLESLISVLSWGAGMFFENGEAPGPTGQHHPLSSPYGRFRAGDGYLNIAAANPTMWEKLVRALGREEWLSDERFARSQARIHNREALTEAIEEALSAHSVDHWVEVINRAGVPCGPVLSLDQVFSDPQVLARKMLVEMPHPERGVFKTTGLPIKLGRTPGAIERRPPLHGEHTDEVLAEAGLSPSECAALRERGVI
jgi:CoA:oxalate CoA-transferase